MSTRATSLDTIRTFDQLLEYLEQELDWPIDEMEIEELTFEYDPEKDLGLAPETAAKIKSIRQLRPLTTKQPFGIFFVEFDRKSLPVVVMRRILGRLVTRKRESANPSDRATWKQDDLLFISAYGEDQTRRVDFAHFADDAKNGLPTLRVLGWDADDTERKLEHVDKQLREKLSWPDGADANEWRTQWRDAFVLRHREVIDTSRKLAHELAVLAQRIRARVLSAIALESPTGPLRKLHKAFQDSLIHDLDRPGFADMYAQTIAYGLLSAEMTAPGSLDSADALLRIPKTNPFLHDLMEEFVRIGGRQKQAPGSVGIDFDELGVNDVVELLRDANIEAVIADFGREKPGEDPVIHFYEYFMTVYDKAQKVSRGVFYTPKPVVSFIVRSVDEILREEFALPLGLADTTTWGEMAERHDGLEIPDTVSPEDPFVQILDPATGTGTFLVEVIDLIHTRMHEHWLAEGHGEPQLERLWNKYVPEHLLPRLYGFELMMAPYAIAHMKIGLKLADTGYRFQSEQRLRVFLTNSLEPPTDLSQMLEFVAPFLAHEARAAECTKRQLSPTVYIGNPPYANFGRQNRSDWIMGLLDAYKQNLDERKINLDDDYIKFIRVVHEMAHGCGVAVVGIISNNSYLDGATHREMRRSLLSTFSTINILDLHGSSKRREVSPDGGADENVFEIQQGVAVALLRRGTAQSRVMHHDFYGTRQIKYDSLMRYSARDLEEFSIDAAAPLYLFVPVDSDTEHDFSCGVSIMDQFHETTTAIQTARDGLVVGFDPDAIAEQLDHFIDRSCSLDSLRERFGVCDGRGFSVAEARAKLRRDGVQREKILPYAYRPFDQRRIYYDPTVVAWPRTSLQQHVARRQNLGLLVTRGSEHPDRGISLVSRGLADKRIINAAKGEAKYLWLWSYPETSSTPVSNLVARVGTDRPEECVAMLYSQLQSQGYLRTFANQLEREYPRVFQPRGETLCQILIATGHDLIALHLLEDDYPHASWNQPGATTPNPLATPITSFCDAGDREVRKAGEKGKAMADSPDSGPGFGRIWINDTAYFDGVPEPVWNFHIGGYQVCHKWLSDRKKKGGKTPRPGRVLTDQDIAHYHRIVIALNETIRLMGEIDETIEALGGWPGAFVTEAQEA